MPSDARQQRFCPATHRPLGGLFSRIVASPADGALSCPAIRAAPPTSVDTAGSAPRAALRWLADINLGIVTRE
jgi:hypothetical protein